MHAYVDDYNTRLYVQRLPLEEHIRSQQQDSPLGGEPEGGKEGDFLYTSLYKVNVPGGACHLYKNN